MKKILFVLGAGLGFAGAAFVFCTMLVLVNNFAEWEWVGYHWPATRFGVGIAFFLGVVMAIIGDDEE